MSIYVKSLASGSSGNAILVRAGGTTLLIDAGFTGKELARRLRALGVFPGDLAAILVTHEHSDHIGGAAGLSRLYKAPVVANRATLGTLRVARTVTRTLPTGETMRIGTIAVTSFSTPHDARDPVGYTLEHEGWRMFVATDLGFDAPELDAHIAASDLIVLEANHDVETLRANDRYPWHLKNRILGDKGHLSNTQTARLLDRALAREPGRRRWLWLAHLSEENNTPVKARTQVELRLDLAKPMRERNLHIEVARRDVPSVEWHSHALSQQLALF